MALTSRLELEVDSGGAEKKVIDMRVALEALEAAGLRASSTMVRTAGDFTSLAMALTRTQAANDKAASSSDGAAKSMESAAKSAADQRKELEALLGKIDPLTKKLNDLAAQEMALVKARNSGDLSPAAYDAYNKKIQESLSILSGATAAQKEMGESAEQAKARLLGVGTAAVEAAQAQRNLSNAATGLSEAQQGLLTSTAGVSTAQARVVASSDSASAAMKQASISSRVQADSLQDLLERIDPTTKALNRLDQQERELAQQKKLGMDLDTFNDYQSKIDRARNVLTGFNSDLADTGKSSRQTEQALRQLPSQFTDIFTSLAGGQNPLLVLIQQGGQIKDSFGGIGPTFDALGAKIKGIFTGTTIAADGLEAIASGGRAAGEGAQAASEGLGSMAEGANTAADASKNAAEAASALKAASSGTGIGLGVIAGGAVVAAAAVAALILAYKQGSDEATAFSTALALTGNTAGTSAAELSEIAKAVSAVNGTVHEAAATLALLAGSTRIPVDAFKSIAVAAANMEDATGKAASETVAEFAKIAVEPVAAILKLNESMNFLTASTYSQIKALQSQGEAEQAAAIATNTYAEAINSRSTKITENLGIVERAWKNLGDAAKIAWDTALGVGRKTPTGPDLVALQQELAYKNSLVGTGYEDDDTKERIAFLQKEIAVIQKRTEAEQASVRAEGELRQAQQQSVADQIKLDKIREETASQAQKRAKELGEYQALVRRREAEAEKLGNKELLISAEQQAKDIAAINEKYKDAKTPKPKAYTEDSGQKMLDEARQRFAVLQQQGKAITDQTTGTATLGAEAKKLIELETMLADLKTKGTLTASQKQILAMGELNTAQQKLNAGLEKQNLLSSAQIENAAKLKAYKDGLNAELALAQEGLDNQNSGAGLGDRAKSRLQDDLKIRQDYQKKINKLTNDYTDSPDKSEGRKQLYEDDVAAARAAQEARLAMQQDSYAKEEALRNNWLAGTSSAWQNYVDIATNYNQQAQDATAMILGDTTLSISDQISGLLRGTVTLGEAFANLGTTMANSVITALSDIAAQWVVTHALKMAGISLETGAVVASESTKASAKVAADGVAKASSLSTIAATLAANISAAVETLASWAPAALVASIGSFGAAAVVGGGAIVAAYALIKGLTGGFSEGGYTGPGGVNQPAGVVHKGEVVWSQADISRFGGVAAVESLRNGNVSPISSAASAKASQSSGSSSGTAAPSQQPAQVSIRLIEDASKAGQSGPSLTEQDVIDIYVANIFSEGDAHNANRQKYGLSSQGA